MNDETNTKLLISALLNDQEEICSDIRNQLQSLCDMHNQKISSLKIENLQLKEKIKELEGKIQE